MTTTQKTTDVTAPDAATGGGRCRDAAMVLLNAAVSYGIVRLNAPVTAAFNMKQTVDAFLTAPVRNNCQKHSQKPFQRVLTRHWKPACRRGSRNTTRSSVSPAVVQGAPDITREIQQDIARRMRAEP